jgi:hypothetical protein
MIFTPLTLGEIARKPEGRKGKRTSLVRSEKNHIRKFGGLSAKRKYEHCCSIGGVVLILISAILRLLLQGAYS